MDTEFAFKMAVHAIFLLTSINLVASAIRTWNTFMMAVRWNGTVWVKKYPSMNYDKISILTTALIFWGSAGILMHVVF